VAKRFKGHMIVSLPYTAIAGSNSTQYRLLARVFCVCCYDDRGSMDRSSIQKYN
jgi:hypothetical protein